MPRSSFAWTIVVTWIGNLSQFGKEDFFIFYFFILNWEGRKMVVNVKVGGSSLTGSELFLRRTLLAPWSCPRSRAWWCINLWCRLHPSSAFHDCSQLARQTRDLGLSRRGSYNSWCGLYRPRRGGGGNHLKILQLFFSIFLHSTKKKSHFSTSTKPPKNLHLQCFREII